MSKKTKTFAALPACPQCGQAPRAEYEPENPFSDAFYLFGCPCDDPDGYGFGPTAALAKSDWVASHCSETRLAMRRNLRAIIGICLPVALGAATALYFPPSWPEIAGIPTSDFAIWTVMGASVVALLSWAAHFLLATPADVAAERGDVANLPHSASRL